MTDIWSVPIVVADPDQLLTDRPDKRHAIKFETSPGQWQVILLSDKELTELGCKVHDRWEDKVFYGDE